MCSRSGSPVGGAGNNRFAIDEASVVRYDIAAALAREGLYNSADPTKNRVKIEGLAVRTLPSGPPGTPCASARTRGRPARAGRSRHRLCRRHFRPAGDGTALPLRKLFTFAAGTRENGGVRSQLASLDYAPALGGFLIVTSSEDQNNSTTATRFGFCPTARASGPARLPSAFGCSAWGKKRKGCACLTRPGRARRGRLPRGPRRFDLRQRRRAHEQPPSSRSSRSSLAALTSRADQSS
jgi:hypothetical protein